MILHVSKPYQYSNKASLTPPHLEPPPCLQGGGYNTGKYMGNSNSIKAHIVPFAGIRQKSGGTRYLCEGKRFSPELAMGKYFDRDTKVAYVEQINTGKMTVTEAVNELGCSRSAIYSWIKKLSEDGEHGLPGSGHMKPDLEYQRQLEKENRQLKNEITFLKKAAAYFAGDQRKGTR
jgi:transposase